MNSKKSDRPDAGGGVRVKPLEWVERVGVTDTFDANTSIGHYIASITDDGRGHWFIVGLTTSNYTTANIEAVKAAAQADYEQRVLSALSTPPAAAESNASAEAEFPSWIDEDKAYELGRRDGYELAVQDIDLATGGDGEFKGSTIPGETVDVPAMKQRIIGRFAADKSVEARLREALRDVYSLFDDEGNFREEHQDHASTALEKAERAMALSAVGDEAKKSEGGKPSSEASSHEKRRLDASDEQTSTGPETSISPVRTIAQSPASAHTANHGVTAGETATPSDPTAERREIVARIINPAAFNSPRSDPGISVAREKADAILAALDRGR